MSIRLSERDLKVLAKCAVSKGLTTGQLRRLYFQNVTVDAACKSLRRLTDGEYLVSHRENRMSEVLHTVGRKGQAILQARGLEVELVRAPPRQLEHMIGINEIRVAVEAEPDRVVYFFACWELGGLGWAYPVIPDAIFELKYVQRRKFVLEFDRATEPREVLWRKLSCYRAGLPRFPFHALVLVTETAARLKIILQYLASRASPVQILGAALADIRKTGIYAPVFQGGSDPTGKPKSLGDAIP